MKHENPPDGNDQQEINEYVVYLYQCSKLSLTVYANSLTEEQRELSRKHLKQYLKADKNRKENAR